MVSEKVFFCRVDVLDFDIVQQNLYTCLPYKICSILLGGFLLKIPSANAKCYFISHSVCMLSSHSRYISFLSFLVRWFRLFVSFNVCGLSSPGATWYWDTSYGNFTDVHVKTSRKGVYYVWYCIHVTEHPNFVHLEKKKRQTEKGNRNGKL